MQVRFFDLIHVMVKYFCVLLAFPVNQVFWLELLICIFSLKFASGGLAPSVYH